MQNPPPPPPPSGPPMMPPPPPGGGLPPPPSSGGGMPPMMPPGSGAMVAPGNLASPGMRIVGGVIDLVILIVINGIIGTILQKVTGLAGVINLVLDVGYFAYMWSSQGASVGMMPFGFKVRDIATGQYPSLGKAAVRGLIWVLEVILTFCIIGAVGWLWQLWDPQKQAIHDKIAGTIVTTN